MKGEIISVAKELFENIESLNLEDKIDVLNQLKLELHKISPMKQEPVDCVLWVKNETVEANDYNPNAVASIEMQLLETSILEDGYTQPIVTFKEDESKLTVVDGYHRNRVGKESQQIKERIHGYLPIVTINEEKTGVAERMASTIRHNRARGKHKVSSMSEIIVDLKKRNWSNEKISKQLGMDADEILRLSQISGLAEIFADKEFSKAWEIVLDDENINNEESISEIVLNTESDEELN
jgi:ParB-like chromosome segregation protein Spo0J